METRFACIIVTVTLSLSILGLLFSTQSSQATPGMKVAPSDPALRADPIGWENLGLYGAHTNSVAFGPVNGTVYLAANGGFYKGVTKASTDGQSWTEWTQFVDVGGQAVAAGRVVSGSQVSERLFIGRVGIWVSADEGVNWDKHPEADGQVWVLAVDPNDGLAAYGGTGDGRIHRTLNGGATWSTTTLNANQCIKSLAVDPTNGSKVWAIGGQCVNLSTGSTVYRSLDKGTNFEPVQSFSNANEVGQVRVDGNGVVYAGGNGVYVSSNGGATFDKMMTFGVSRLAIDPFSQRVHGDGYYSDDHGMNWFGDGLPGLFGIDPINAGRMFAPSGRVSSAPRTVGAPGKRTIKASRKCW